LVWNVRVKRFVTIIKARLHGLLKKYYLTDKPFMAPYSSLLPFNPLQTDMLLGGPVRNSLSSIPGNVAYTLTEPINPIRNYGHIEQTSMDRAVVAASLFHLAGIVNRPDDLLCLRSMGVFPPFRSGREALWLIQSRGIAVEFGDMGDSPAHAQWEADKRQITLNARYRGDTSPATLYALSEAIYHEAGHAAGNGDNRSSIQEELNCLGLNALGYRCHVTRDPAYAAVASRSPLIANGVALYSRLFFTDPDPTRNALINRVIEKYGDLPLSSPGHPVPTDPNSLARRIQQRLKEQEANDFPYLSSKSEHSSSIPDPPPSYVYPPAYTYLPVSAPYPPSYAQAVSMRQNKNL
jgi:hypothetical protein